MFSFKKSIVALMVGLSGLGIGAFAFAQGIPQSISITNDGSAKITGTVTAVSSSTISVASWGGTWSVNVANATFLPAGTATLSQIAVGDKVTVKGKVTSGMSVAATSVREKIVKVSLGADNDTRHGNAFGLWLGGHVGKVFKNK